MPRTSTLWPWKIPKPENFHNEEICVIFFYSLFVVTEHRKKVTFAKWPRNLRSLEAVYQILAYILSITHKVPTRRSNDGMSTKDEI